MRKRVTITYEIDASEKSHVHRDELFAPVKALGVIEGLHTWVDLHQVSVISKELESKTADMRNKLKSELKNIGLKPIGDEKLPELHYGIYGDEEGPISFWYQMSGQ